MCTNLEDSVEDMIKLKHRRRKIEESFRIMKTDFEVTTIKFLSRQKNKKLTQF